MSRWFIEREGGNRVVRRLIMLGTPNGGSPVAARAGLGDHGAGGGLNELSKVVWPASVLAGLVQAIELVDVTLDQMVPDSAFLQDLNASPDPKRPVPHDRRQHVADPGVLGARGAPVEIATAAAYALVGAV